MNAGEPTGEQGRVLPIISEIQAIVRQITGYITDELMFSTVQNMRAFYKTRSGLTPMQLQEQE